MTATDVNPSLSCVPTCENSSIPGKSSRESIMYLENVRPPTNNNSNNQQPPTKSLPAGPLEMCTLHLIGAETYYGAIETIQDSILLVETCRRGFLPRVPRRLGDRERALIRPGSVFVFVERESGIKRWTDGKIWSPSRITGDFLSYRQLENRPAIPNATTRRAIAVAAASSTGTMAGMKNNNMAMINGASMMANTGMGIVPCNEEDEEEEYYDTDSIDALSSNTSHQSGRQRNTSGLERHGTVVKKNGLVKRTISLRVNEEVCHLISYTLESSALDQTLRSLAPSKVPGLVENLKSAPFAAIIPVRNSSNLSSNSSGHTSRSAATRGTKALQAILPGSKANGMAQAALHRGYAHFGQTIPQSSSHFPQVKLPLKPSSHQNYQTNNTTRSNTRRRSNSYSLSFNDQSSCYQNQYSGQPSYPVYHHPHPPTPHNNSSLPSNLSNHCHGRLLSPNNELNSLKLPPLRSENIETRMNVLSLMSAANDAIGPDFETTVNSTTNNTADNCNNHTNPGDLLTPETSAASSPKPSTEMTEADDSLLLHHFVEAIHRQVECCQN